MDLSKHKGAYNGATINILGPDQNKPQETQVFEGVWVKDRPDEDDYEIGCIMGACYFIPRGWFFHIGGLRNLRMWGLDEPFLSLKTWLAGGECRMMKTVQIGHKFRTSKEQDFKISKWNTEFNRLFSLATILNPKEADFLIRRIPHSVELKRAKEHFEKDCHIVEYERLYNQWIFSGQGRDLRWYCEKFGLRYPLD